MAGLAQERGVTGRAVDGEQGRFVARSRLSRRRFLAAAGYGMWQAGRGGSPPWSGSPPAQEAVLTPARGPLRPSRVNPRYFEDPEGRVVYLSGIHTWSNLLDMGLSDPPEPFDFDSYLQFLQRYSGNFLRLWTWESSTWDTRGNGLGHMKTALHHVRPLCWRRTGPGTALDGKPRFDLAQFDEEYFQRLQHRVERLGEHGIYVAVMLFEGWGLQFSPGAWESHPFHPANNVNGIAGDRNLDGSGTEVHTLAVPEITRLQESYVRKVVDTLNRFDNVLYEICNEADLTSTEWQYHMIRYLRDYQLGKPRQHPIGMTVQYRGGSNSTLWDSAADWISPNADPPTSRPDRLWDIVEDWLWEPDDYRDDPPPADGRKVVVADTDHLWGIGGSQSWVWKCFTRGLNTLFMDPYDGRVLANAFDPRWEPIRRSLAQTRRWAERLDLASAVPEPSLASSRYCLAAAGQEYLVYLPLGGSVRVNLKREAGNFGVEWFDPNHDQSLATGSVRGGEQRDFQSPFTADSVLYLRSEKLPPKPQAWQR